MLTPLTIRHVLDLSGYALDEERMEFKANYLADKGYIAIEHDVPSEVGARPTVKLLKITTAGLDYVERRRAGDTGVRLYRGRGKAMADEQWKPVVGYEGLYEVSDLGRVRRSAPGRGTRVGRMLRPYASKPDGCPTVMLTRGGRYRPHDVHCLVARAFLGGRGEAHRVRDRVDPRLSNLVMVTHQERQDMLALAGRLGNGERQPNAKLTVEKVREIRRLAATGVAQRRIAAIFGISQPHAERVANGKSWRHVA